MLRISDDESMSSTHTIIGRYSSMRKHAASQDNFSNQALVERSGPETATDDADLCTYLLCTVTPLDLIGASDCYDADSLRGLAHVAMPTSLSGVETEFRPCCEYCSSYTLRPLDLAIARSAVSIQI